MPTKPISEFFQFPAVEKKAEAGVRADSSFCEVSTDVPQNVFELHPSGHAILPNSNFIRPGTTLIGLKRFIPY